MKKREPSRWLKATGEAVDVFPSGKKWTLPEIQKMVGGYMEIVGRTNLPPGRVMIVNEDGLSQELALNNKASLIAGQTIVGDVLIVNREELE